MVADIKWSKKVIDWASWQQMRSKITRICQLVFLAELFGKFQKVLSSFIIGRIQVRPTVSQDVIATLTSGRTQKTRKLPIPRTKSGRKREGVLISIDFIRPVTYWVVEQTGIVGLKCPTHHLNYVAGYSQISEWQILWQILWQIGDKFVCQFVKKNSSSHFEVNFDFHPKWFSQ